MAKAIIEGMEKEKSAGNLELGRVGDSNQLADMKKVAPFVEVDSLKKLDRF